MALRNGESYTLEQVSKKVGVTRERVRQIKTQALSQLHRPTHSRQFRIYPE